MIQIRSQTNPDEPKKARLINWFVCVVMPIHNICKNPALQYECKYGARGRKSAFPARPSHKNEPFANTIIRSVGSVCDRKRPHSSSFLLLQQKPTRCDTIHLQALIENIIQFQANRFVKTFKSCRPATFYKNRLIIYISIFFNPQTVFATYYQERTASSQKGPLAISRLLRKCKAYY